MDLFGDTITTPQCAASSIPKSLLNAAYGFPEFWKSWPSHQRKVDKQKSLDTWARLGCAANATHIIAYVESLKSSEDWLRGFLPMPRTFLNRQGWIDWEQPAPKVPRRDILAELKSHKGTKPSAAVRAEIERLRGTVMAADRQGVTA